MPKGSEQNYKRGAGLKMTIANIGVGAILQFASCVVVVSIGASIDKCEEEFDRILRNSPDALEYSSRNKRK